MGEKCNNDMAYALGRFDKYKQVDMVIKAKSSRMFNQCGHAYTKSMWMPIECRLAMYPKKIVSNLIFVVQKL